jgi:cysteinyl-tRNA synthetase
VDDVAIPMRTEAPSSAGDDRIEEQESLWDRIHEIERAFQIGLGKRDPGDTTNALLELDRSVWKAQQDLEASEVVSQAREVFRDLVVQLGMMLEVSPLDRRECLAPLVEKLLERRVALRQEKRWEEADFIREALQEGGVLIEDTPAGSRWHLAGPNAGGERDPES